MYLYYWFSFKYIVKKKQFQICNCLFVLSAFIPIAGKTYCNHATHKSVSNIILF